MAYVVWKYLHILAVCLFLGNIITGLFWKALADRDGTSAARLQAMTGIIASDRWFTVPGVILIVLSGVTMARLAEWPLLRTAWIGLSIGFFSISGLLFALFVAPLQRRMREMLAAAVRTGTLDELAYRRLSLKWEIWGLLAIALPLVALGVMILKPVAYPF